ncbi:MAG TPA: aldo/keto reductase [Gemmataceae bacterium]|nr:aldo/keto reductase [Gemmataceae bacterium]
MDVQTLTIAGVQVPRFLYGTAWKEDETERLMELALRQGFRGIDTANQRKHYHEEGVGRGIAAAIAGGVVTREELFLQTKFTFRRGQDHRLPYDPAAPVTAQVAQSFASSLAHLGTDVIDSFVLHGPSVGEGLAAVDWEAWRAIEELHAAGRARLLGISNVTPDQLQLLCERARIRPHFVQNRCYAALGWDRDVRAVCGANGITYQSFSLLTGNRQVLTHPAVHQIARKHGRGIAQVIFRFALHVRMIPLTGTTSADHMRADLDVFDFHLDADDVAQIEACGER